MNSPFHLEGSSILLLDLTERFYAEMWAQVKLSHKKAQKGAIMVRGRNKTCGL